MMLSDKLAIMIASSGLLVSMYGAFSMRDDYKGGFRLLIIGHGIMMFSMLLKGEF